MGKCCSKSLPILSASSFPKQSDENLEDLTVVWLDANIHQSHSDHRQARLRSIINYLKTFDDSNECLNYISSVKNEKVFLIVSGSLGESFVPKIYHLPQMAFIYVFCHDREKHQQWAQMYSKHIRGVFNDKQLLFVKLNGDVILFSKSLTPTGIFGSQVNEKSIQDFKNERTMYMWLQLLIEILLYLPHTMDAKREMLEVCRKQYQNNEIEEKNIKDFEDNYSANDAIFWYTRDTFIYRLLNKAFRTEDIIILYQFRFFIVDLYQQLRDLHAQVIRSGPKETLITVYRGQFISTNELKKIQENIDGLIALNTFLSTTIDLQIAIIYSGEGACRPLVESVVFEMEIDQTVLTEKPFANIEQFSAMKDEKEILLSMGSIFLIQSVQACDNYWRIRLRLCDDENPKLKALAEHYKKKMGQSPTVVTLADHLWSMGEYDKAERFYSMLLIQLLETDPAIPFVYHGLGLVHLDKGDYSLALSYLEKGLTRRLETLTGNHPDIAQSYNDIAEIYRLKGEYDQALNIHQKALRIRLTSLPADHEDLIETYNNLGLTYDARDELSQAMETYFKAINIALRKLPLNHPQFAVVYLNLGNTYCKVKDYPHAIEYLERALEILLQSLPSNHAEISNTYIGLGNVYVYEKNYEKALDYYQKALKIDCQQLQADHPDLALTYHNIGQAYLYLEEFSKAMEHFQKTLSIQQIALPTFHPHLAETYSSIGQVLEKNGHYIDALGYHEKALEIAKHCLTPTHDTVRKFQYRIEVLKEKL